MTSEHDLSTPLLIYNSKHQLIWTNPDILSTVKFSEEDPTCADTPVQRVWLYDKNKAMVLTVILHSPSLEAFWDASFDENFEPIKNDDLTKKIVQRLFLEFETMFLEDVWAPGGEQFCFTKIGKTIGSAFRKVRSIEFSPDCALWYDPEANEPFGYDT